MGARNIVSDEEEEYEEEEVRDARDREAADGEEEEDEEAEEEGQDEYEKDGFIVDDVEEEEEEEEEVKENSDEEMKAKKKKRKKRDTEENYELDEDDYELLQEANVTGFHRPKSGSKKFKRLKKAGRNADIAEEKTGFSDEDDLEEGGRMGSTAEEKLKRSLFGDDEGVPPEDVAEEEEQPEEEEEEDLGEEDEMADFIVDEEEVDENGLPVRRKKSKKRMARQAPGISSSALQEAQDIFGDVDELLSRRKQGLKAKGLGGVEGVDDEGFKRLEDEFEPSVLAEKYMTAKDDQIRETDVPERFQLSEEISGPVPHNEDTVPEAKWIYEQAFVSLAVPMRAEFQHIAELDKDKVVKEISNVLQMFHDQKLEVPFIAMYRKEKCLNLLQDQEQNSTDNEEKDENPKLKTHKALWAIQLWDRKWLLLQRRKNALNASYEKRAAEEARRDHNKLNILESVLQSLVDAESERTVDDIDTKFNLHFPPDEVEVEEGQFKRPKRKSLYSICRKAGLGGLSQKFSLSSEQLGENLRLMYKKHEVEDATVTPEEVAAEFSAREFGDSQSVLKGARHMAAVEISCEPAVKEHARSVYMDKALVTTRPTTDGDSAIDSFHEYAGVKWLVNKPITMFDDAQWLLIQKAEEEKLLQVTIGLPKEAIDEDLMGELESHYLSDGVSRAAQLWNEQRKLIVKEALCQYILPNMEKEARMVLTARAKSWLVQDYGMQLWKKASVAPYKRQKRDEDHADEDSETRVMACCQGSTKDPTTFVMLDSSGEVVDTLFMSHFSIRSKNPSLVKRKEIDQQRFLKFMMDHQPHVVALGASNIYCKHLKDGIFEAIFKIVEEHPRELFTDGLDTVHVVYGDVVLPSLYEKSRISQDQLPTQKGLVRRATALGRYLQNPLAMVATLCGPGREILSLKLHPLEHFLNPDERYEAIEQVMVTVTNQVGVDINLAASHEWMFSPLQFVSGLGPRKAASLQRAILRAGRIYTRRELLTTLGAMKRLVFINAAGFLRVRGTGQAASGNHVMDPLDDTRIHPESYELAKKMAEDVYCEDVGQDIEDMDEEAQEMAIEHVKSNPHVLNVLDIDEYGRSVEQRTGDRKNETLNDIKIELLHGFQEWRPEFKQPTQDEEFYLLTGESEETLSEGKIVQASVRFVQNQRVVCDLESGLTGMILKEELSDDRDIDAIDKITEGTILTCRVKGIQKAKYIVDLTCKASELRGEHWQSGQIKDPFYAKDESLLHSEHEKAKKEKELAKKSFKSRMIVHPRFQNISAEEAIGALSDKDAGESVIRPSYRGPSYLTLSLKVCDGVYAHKDIVEGGKDHRDFTTYLRLGKTLSIGEDTFEDLDEVIDRYVDPLVSNLKAILAYRKFRRGTKAEIDDVLRKEKFENPIRIPYYLSVSHEHPGAFILSYIRGTNPHHEYVGLYPKGFKFRKRMFDNLDKLIAYFQKHVNDLVQDSLPPIRSVAAMVPMKSPGPGGSAGGGGSVGSGWGGSATNSGAGGDGGWQGHSGADWERSSTPGSRTGGNDFNHNNASDGPPSGLPRPPHSRDRGRGGRGGGGRFGGWNEGRGGGFGRDGNDGRGGGMRGRWSEDGGNRRGRNSGRVRGVGRGSFESNNNNRWGQSPDAKEAGGSFSNQQGGDGWGSKTDDWGSNSGNRIQDSPARGGWTVSSGESGWNKQGNDGHDIGKLNDGWNSAKINDQDATSKGNAGGWASASKGVIGGWHLDPSSGNSGWDAPHKVGQNDGRMNSVKSSDKSSVGWGGTEAAINQHRQARADGWGGSEAGRGQLQQATTDSWAMDGEKGTDSAPTGWPKESDGWNEGAAVHKANAGGSGWV